MKQVIKVSINKIPFTIAEDGYQVLKVYLDHLRRYYSGQEGGNEVVDDIEERIGELLSERTQGGERVVSKADVDEVLAIMGTPEVIEEEGAGSDASSHTPNYKPVQKPVKRFYRDPEHRIFGGVCSGFAAYFDFDLALVRVIFVAVLIGFGFLFRFSFFNPNGWFLNGWIILAYILLWIFVPAARSVEERCAMRGEPVSTKGIQDRARTQPSYRSSSYEPRRQSTGSRILGGIVRAIAIVFGLFLLLISTVILIAVIASLFFSTTVLFDAFPSDFLNLVAFSGNLFWMKACLLVACGMPVVGLIYLGCVLLFRIKGHGWIGLTMFLVWLASLIGLVCFGSHNLKDYRSHRNYEENVPIALTSDTLFIDLVANSTFQDDRYLLEANQYEYELAWMEGDRKDLTLVAFPPVQLVRQSPEEEPSLRIKYSAFGRNSAQAQQRAEQYKPSYSLEGNVLTIDAFVNASQDEKWKGNLGEMVLYVPHDQVVIVRKPVEHEFGKTPNQSIEWNIGWNRWGCTRWDWD